MCGIVGILHRNHLGDAPARVRTMANSIVHRGPDEEGFWSDADAALGFRRLAIVDLESGQQPMTNEDRSVWVIFNGEIYNHRELRRELEARGHRFATDHSDTEVLVHGYEEWGEALPGKLNGMFAFAVWDSRRRQLMLARDRLGIKPLYIAETGGGDLVFASELRAIHASGLVGVAPDDNAMLAYFQNQNVWQSRSMFKGVAQLRAGHLLVDDGRSRRETQFWDITFNRRRISRRDAAYALRAALEGAIERQLAADVPVMAYLSGGIDSSAIVAGAYRLDPGVRAYSCLFDLTQVGDDKIVDEREFSRLVAQTLGIQHVEMELEQTALIGSLFPTISALEEPRMGMAYVNYLIARRVAADSKVVLSGCGGDEILGGYVSRYGRAGAVGASAPRSLLRRMLGLAAPSVASTVPAHQRILPLYRYPLQPGEISSAFTPAFRAAAGEFSLEDELRSLVAAAPSDHVWDKLLYADAKTYLAGLLMVEDKLAMASSLEARVPLLDNEVIDLALSYDWSLLTDGTTGKIVFRDAIRDWVPPLIADKPKMGFGPPDASWYRGALQPWIRQMLAPERIAARGVFEPTFVQEAIDAHMAGTANKIPFIWSLLSFEAWCELFGLYGGDLGRPMRPELSQVA
jgi:asparagine synthase (glutamine-hydrolysing)